MQSGKTSSTSPGKSKAHVWVDEASDFFFYFLVHDLMTLFFSPFLLVPFSFNSNPASLFLVLLAHP